MSCDMRGDITGGCFMHGADRVLTVLLKSMTSRRDHKKGRRSAHKPDLSQKTLKQLQRRMGGIVFLQNGDSHFLRNFFNGAKHKSKCR